MAKVSRLRARVDEPDTIEETLAQLDVFAHCAVQLAVKVFTDTGDTRSADVVVRARRLVAAIDILREPRDVSGERR